MSAAQRVSRGFNWFGLFLATIPLYIGVSYATDKIALVCSGTATFYWKETSTYWKETSTERKGPDGFVIDLDGGIVTWGDAAIPIRKVSETGIDFDNESAQAWDSHSYIGDMDRVTGKLSIYETWIRDSWEPHKPDLKLPREETISYDLTCKRTNPAF